MPWSPKAQFHGDCKLESWAVYQIEIDISVIREALTHCVIRYLKRCRPITVGETLTACLFRTSMTKHPGNCPHKSHMLVALDLWSVSLWTDELPLPRANMAFRYSCLGMAVWPPMHPARRIIVIPPHLGACELAPSSSLQHPKSSSDNSAQANNPHNPTVFNGCYLASKTGGSETLRSCCTNGVNRP